MAGTTLGPDTGGLLAKKGAARPAMRRQAQIQQSGFGSGNGFGGGAGALSGWLTGAEDDCGWNDMGEGAAPNYGAAAQSRSAIGLTAMSNSPDSLYVDGAAGGADWDEADSYDDANSDWNAPAETPTAAQPAMSAPQPTSQSAANPVGAMHERLKAATGAEFPTRGAPEPLELREEDVIPAGLFGAIRAGWARFVSLVVGRGPVTVLHLEPALRERLRNAAMQQGLDEADIAERAIEDYLGAIASKNAKAAKPSWS